VNSNFCFQVTIFEFNEIISYTNESTLPMLSALSLASLIISAGPFSILVWLTITSSCFSITFPFCEMDEILALIVVLPKHSSVTTIIVSSSFSAYTVAFLFGPSSQMTSAGLVQSSFLITYLYSKVVEFKGTFMVLLHIQEGYKEPSVDNFTREGDMAFQLPSHC